MDEKVKISFRTNQSCELARQTVEAILNIYPEFRRPGAYKATPRTITISLPIAKLLPGELERQTADVWEVVDELGLDAWSKDIKKVAGDIIKDARYAADEAVLRIKAVHDLERTFDDASLGRSMGTQSRARRTRPRGLQRPRPRRRDDADREPERGRAMSPALQRLTTLAKDGERLTYQPEDTEKPKTLWAGLGNRAGLHSFQFTLLREKWEKSGARMLKRVSELPEGTVINVLSFHNIDRDRGRWVKAMEVTL